MNFVILAMDLLWSVATILAKTILNALALYFTDGLHIISIRLTD